MPYNTIAMLVLFSFVFIFFSSELEGKGVFYQIKLWKTTNFMFYIFFFIIIITFLSISYEKSNEMNNLFIFYMLLPLVAEERRVDEGREETRGRNEYNMNCR